MTKPNVERCGRSYGTDAIDAQDGVAEHYEAPGRRVRNALMLTGLRPSPTSGVVWVAGPGVLAG
jgi:hypothetical protein